MRVSSWVKAWALCTPTPSRAGHCVPPRHQGLGIVYPHTIKGWALCTARLAHNGRRMRAYVCVGRRKRPGGAKRRRGGRAPAKAAPEAGPGELRSKFRNLRSKFKRPRPAVPVAARLAHNGRRMRAYVCVDRRKRPGGAKRRRGGRAPAKAAPEAGPGELRSKFNNLRSMVECGGILPTKEVGIHLGST